MRCSPRSAHGKVQNKGYLSRNDRYVGVFRKGSLLMAPKKRCRQHGHFPFHWTRPTDHDNEWRVYDTGSGTFFYGSNFEKVAIDGDTTMLRLAENGTKFTPVTDEANACVYTDGKLRSFVRLAKIKTTCSINDCIKVKTGMFTQWHPVKMRQKNLIVCGSVATLV